MYNVIHKIKFSVENNNNTKPKRKHLVKNVWLFIVKKRIQPIIGNNPPAKPNKQSKFKNEQVAMLSQKRS